jgi:DNA-binding IclR family transcriptional regulator
VKHTLVSDPSLPEGRGAEATESFARSGIRSVTVAARILKTLAAHGGVLPLKHVAAATGMPRAKAHRYLASLRAAGLVAQDGETGHYRIGPAAISIGLVGLGRMSAVRQLQEALPRLRDKVNETVTAAIWSERGPTVIAMEESDHLVTMNVRIGTVLPVLTTAIGRIFLAYLPHAATQRLVAAERLAGAQRAALPSDNALAANLADIRAKRISEAKGALLPGVDALAAPVFDYRGSVAAVICVVVRAAPADKPRRAAIAKALVSAANDLSRQLGFVE